MTEDSNWGWYVLIFLFLASLGVGGYLLFKKNQDSWMAPKNEQPLEKNFIEKEEPRPIQIS